MRSILLAAVFVTGTILPLFAQPAPANSTAPGATPPAANVLPEGSVALPRGAAELLLVYLDGRSSVASSLQEQVGRAIQTKPQACTTTPAP